jgi:molecular chaperone DnaJ
VLGLTREADRQDIAKSYRRLARKYHPDVNKADDAEEKFREVANAYEVIHCMAYNFPTLCAITINIT